MKRAIVPILIGVLPSLLAYGGCSDGTSASSDDAGSDTSHAQSESSSDVGLSDIASDIKQEPVYDENGWLRLELDPDYACDLYTAPSAEKMPPPLVWEPCLSTGVPSLQCRQMQAQWVAPGPNGHFAQTRTAWVGPGNLVFVAVHQRFPSRHYHLVAEADGPVHHAIRSSGDCYLVEDSVREDHVTYLASREEPNGSGTARRGGIGGAFDEAARVLASYPNQGNGGGRGFVAGRDAFFERGAGGLIVSDWTAKQLDTLSLGAPGQLNTVFFQSGTLFLDVGDLTYGRLRVWTQGAGTQDLISYGDDVSHNAVDLGSDGVDLVWIEGVGRASNSQPFATYDLMTSPYTTKAAEVQKRRVRSADAGGFGLSPNVVGCGYAARKSVRPGDRGVRVTRLADGRSWRIADTAPYQYLETVAVTCDEVFVAVNVRPDTSMPGTSNLVRIRLDSLGPGEAAD